MALRFDSFRLRLTLLFGGLSLLLGLTVTTFVTQAAMHRLAIDRSEALSQLSHVIATVLAENLRERQREIELLSRAPLYVRSPLDSPELRADLDRVRSSYRYYAWIGLTDAQGVIRSASDGLLQGVPADTRPWFVHGSRGRYVGDVHEALLLAKSLKPEDPSEPLRFVDFAAPVLDGQGALRGVLAAHSHWSWVRAAIQSVAPARARQESIEVFVLNAEGQMLHPFESIGTVPLPAELPESGAARLMLWQDLGEALTASARVGGSEADLGWRVVVRQPKAQALAVVAELRRTLLLLGAPAAALFMLLAWRLAVGFSRPLEQLSRQAQRIEQGEEDASLEVRTGTAELQRLAASLRGMTERLLLRKRQLVEANQSLEHKVEERTAELSALNAALERLARHDGLTGLSNRRAAEERLRAEFLLLRRTEEPYAVLMADIDHFKAVNDTHGHEAGDRVLRQVARTLASSIRATDFAARFGGEEFVVVLPHTDVEGAVTIAEKLRRAVEAQDFPGVGRVTLSIGASGARSGDDGPEHALRRADAALYRAKAEGRNAVRCG